MSLVCILRVNQWPMEERLNSFDFTTGLCGVLFSVSSASSSVLSAICMPCWTNSFTFFLIRTIAEHSRHSFSMFLGYFAVKISAHCGFGFHSMHNSFSSPRHLLLYLCFSWAKKLIVSAASWRLHFWLFWRDLVKGASFMWSTIPANWLEEALTIGLKSYSSFSGSHYLHISVFSSHFSDHFFPSSSKVRILVISMNLIKGELFCLVNLLL